MSYLEQNQATGRHIFPDLVRSFAILGIVLVNVAYLAFPGEATYHAGGLNTALDKTVYFGVNALFLFKSYSLFSFMFGVGLAYQMQAAERYGTRFTPRYFRRMLGLLILGILHVSFAFAGDILILYAVLGCLLFVFRNASQTRLIRWGVALIILQIIVTCLFTAGLYAGEIYAPEEMKTQATEMEARLAHTFTVFREGSFQETIHYRWQEWIGYLFFALPVQGPGVFGFFLLGLATVRSGILTDTKAALWHKARRVYLPFGLIISAIGAYIMTMSVHSLSAYNMLGTTLVLIAAPFSTFGYLGLIAKWADSPASAFTLFMARGGTSTLTAYLLQSLMLAWIFNGYGLGLYGDIGAAGCVMIALCVGGLSLCFSSLWRMKFMRGPFEYALRYWTYLGAR